MTYLQSAFGHKLLGVVSCIFFLVGCDNLPEQLKQKTDTSKAPLAGGSLKLEERDVEAPDVFSITDRAIWDGRPSFGGVWVALPGNTQPERVTIKNVGNGKSVVGALFKREAENPGPPITLSSDAASALGIIAGEPTEVSVVALRRQAIDVTPQSEAAPATDEVMETVLAPIEGVEPSSDAALTTSISDAISNDTSSSTATEPAPTPRSENAPSKPFLQAGTYSSEANADVLVKKLESAGVPATLRSQKLDNGKTLYRVLAGPAQSSDLLKSFAGKVAELGINDAFPVAN